MTALAWSTLPWLALYGLVVAGLLLGTWMLRNVRTGRRLRESVPHHPVLGVPLVQAGPHPADHASTIRIGGSVYGNALDRRCWLCGAVDVPMTWTLDGYICDGPCRSKAEQDAAGWQGG